MRTSLVVQWLRIRLPMQGTRVRALVREDPTCRGATKPMCHYYWACALEPVSHNYWDHMPQLLKPVCLESVLRSKRSHCNEKPVHATNSSPSSPQLQKARTQQRRPNAAKNKIKKKKTMCEGETDLPTAARSFPGAPPHLHPSGLIEREGVGETSPSSENCLWIKNCSIETSRLVWKAFLFLFPFIALLWASLWHFLERMILMAQSVAEGTVTF